MIDYDYFLGSCVVCFVGTRHAVSVCFDVMTRFSRTRRAVSLQVGVHFLLLLLPSIQGGAGGWVFSSLFRNNLRRILLHHPAYVERDYEEDHDGGYTYTSEEGHDGGYEMLGNHFRYSPLLQELAEEYNGRDGKYACHTYEPQIEATEEQGDVFALGAVHLAECHFLLA